jgi:hypothetical protein
LNDPSPNVRAAAIHGVFHIVALFWEVIPAHVVKELVTKMVSKNNASTAISWLGPFFVRLAYTGFSNPIVFRFIFVIKCFLQTPISM